MTAKLLPQVSKLPFAFGGAALSGEGGGYGFGPIGEEDSLDLVHEAFDAGVRVFDTAPIYGFGLSEKRLGKAIKSKREEAFLISKSGVTWHPNRRVNMTNDPQVAEKMLEQSLRDLQTDYIDLYMVHWPDSKVDIRKTLEPLARAKREGKIRHLGLCNTNADELAKASEIDRIEVVQNQLNLFEREAQTLFPTLEKEEMSFMGWGTLDKGIITGRVNRERTFDSNDCRSWAPWWKQMNKEEKYQKIEKIRPIVKEEGHTLLELALGFSLSYPQANMALCGPKSSEQLKGILKALDHLPSLKTLKRVDDVLTSKK